MVTLRILYPGSRLFLWEVKLKIFLDTQQVGIGFIRKGVDVLVETSVGEHALEVHHYFARNRFDLKLTSPGRYALDLVYTGNLQSFDGKLSYMG